jgi:hypothetical protein
MPPANTPLYSHALNEIETWLADQGCRRATDNISKWKLTRPDWSAVLLLDRDSILIAYVSDDGREVARSFKYSLSRADLEEAIFSGP